MVSAESEKYDKRKANRRLRRLNKERIKKGQELKLLREASDRWTFNKDDTKFPIDLDDKRMRK